MTVPRTVAVIKHDMIGQKKNELMILMIVVAIPSHSLNDVGLM